MMKDCIFCKIIKGDIPAYKIYEDENSLAFLDVANDFPYHTLVIPKKHFENVLDCDEKCLSEVMKTVKLISKHYTKVLGYSGVNVLNASGKEAGQTVFHLHFHIIPRKENDKIKAFPKALKNTRNLKEEQVLLQLKQKYEK